MKIVLTFNDAYAPHAAAVIASVLRYTSEPLEVAVIYCSLNEENKEKIRNYFNPRLQSIEFYKVDRLDLKGLISVKAAPHLKNVEVFLRLFAPVFIPDDWVIYLDCDVIIKDDLGKILENLNDSEYIYAVKEYDVKHKLRLVDSLMKVEKPFISYRILDSYYFRVAKYLGMSAWTKYFNTGVMIMNLKKWREDKLSQKIFEFMNEHSHLFSADQDALNAVINGNFGELHPRWNNIVLLEGILTNYSVKELREAEKEPAIVHFAGGLKAWHYRNSSPYKKYYWQYRKDTPWPERKESDKTFVNIVICNFKRAVTAILGKSFIQSYCLKKSTRLFFASAYIEK